MVILKRTKPPRHSGVVIMKKAGSLQLHKE
jgi:hypothetical protein